MRSNEVGATSKAVVAVLGGGRMGRAVARVLSLAGAKVRLWARSGRAREEIRREIPGPTVADEIQGAVDGAELIFLAVPAPALVEVANLYGDCARGDHIVIHASRGVGEGFALPHQMIRSKTCVRKIGVLGGPLHATELATGRPLAAVVASRFPETARTVHQLTAGSPVIIHAGRDVVGVEVAGAISNVSAIAAGMSDALDLGETARGVLLTHGLAEAKRIGIALGAEAPTFAGLAGVGDLIPRKVSSTDRHRVVGARLAHGTALEDALLGIEGSVEGILTAREAGRLTQRLGIDAPLMRAMDDVIRGNTRAREALETVLEHDLDLDARFSGGGHPS